MTDLAPQSQLPPARMRVRSGARQAQAQADAVRPIARALDVEDHPDPPPPPTPPEPPEEGRAEYGQLQGTPLLRYNQIKATEGKKAASEFAILIIQEQLMRGTKAQEMSTIFGWSMPYTYSMMARARAANKFVFVENFDPQAMLAEYLLTYRRLREKTFTVATSSLGRNDAGGYAEFDKHRAREMTLSILNSEITFLEKVGGLKGMHLDSTADDANVVAARTMASGITALIEEVEGSLAIPEMGDTLVVPEASC